MSVQIDEDYQKQTQWFVYKVDNADTVLARNPNEARILVAQQHDLDSDWIASVKVEEVPKDKVVTIQCWNNIVIERLCQLLPNEGPLERNLLRRALALPENFDIRVKVRDLIPLFDEPSFLFSTEW